MIFLGLGVLIGPEGVGLIDIGPHDTTLEVVAVLTLSLVLFLDAINLNLDEVGNDWLIPVLSLGPGTILTVSISSGAAYLILGTTVVESLLLGAILASTDPVVLREVVLDKRIPGSVRRALSVEAGTNDLVILPAVLILIAIGVGETGGSAAWSEFLGRLLVIGPLVGLGIGGVGGWLMAKADNYYGIRREYQALYGIALVLAAYAAADAVGGDGFLAAFAAGLAITIFNIDLCTCFLEYGEVTAEMTMLFSFVLFGAVLSTMIDMVSIGLALLFAFIVLFIARPISFSLVLHRAMASHTARLFIAWFGPRGLNSLLLVLLVVQQDVPNAEWMMAVVGVVVIVSVVAHGMTATPLGTWYGKQVNEHTLEEERTSTAAGLFQHSPTGDHKMTPDELANLLNSENPPIILDVRSRSQFAEDPRQIHGSIRVLPDQISEWIRANPTDRQILAYCT